MLKGFSLASNVWDHLATTVSELQIENVSVAKVIVKTSYFATHLQSFITKLKAIRCLLLIFSHNKYRLQVKSLKLLFLKEIMKLTIDVAY